MRTRLHRGILNGLILSIPIWLLMWSVCFGATYYVDTTSEATCDGTAQAVVDSGDHHCAWPTIAKVNAASFNGDDQILFQRGQTWAEELTVPSSGTDGHQILYGDYGSGALPIITGSGARNTSITASGKSYVTIQNLNLQGWLQRGILNANGNEWIVDGCTISGGSGTGGTVNRGINFYITTDTKITGGIIRNNTFGTIGAGAATGAQKESFFFRAILLQGVDSHQIINNDVVCVDAGGITLDQGTAASGNNANNIISGNEVTNSRMGISVNYSDDTIVTNNHIHDGLGLGISSAYTSSRTIIANNVIHHLTTGSALWNGIDVNINSQNGFVYNNTVYAVHNHCMTLENTTAACNGWTVKNNIFDASANTGGAVPLKYWGLTTVTSDYNDIRSFSTTKDYGANLITNGSLETFTGTPDDGASDNFGTWTEAGGTAAVYEAVTNVDAGLLDNPVPDGTYAGKFTRGSSGANTMVITASVVSMIPYEIRYKALSSGTGTARVAMYVGANYLQNDGSWTASANWALTELGLATANTSWTQKTLRFIPAATGTLTIRFEFNAAAGTVCYMDNWELYRQGDVVASYSPATINYRPYSLTDFRTASSQDANSLSADPQFTSPTTGDFHLRPNSPARNAGTDLGDDYDIDFDGNDQDRFGRGWEIGAHVFKECPVAVVGW